MAKLEAGGWQRAMTGSSDPSCTLQVWDEFWDDGASMGEPCIKIMDALNHLVFRRFHRKKDPSLQYFLENLGATNFQIHPLRSIFYSVKRRWQ